MKSKVLLLVLFLVVVAAQLYVPASMILNRESVLEEGAVYKFKTAPIDPSDPFRGKYIWLNFEADIFTVSDKDAWESGETVYARIDRDEDGFARLADVTKTAPEEGDYITTTVSFVDNDNDLYLDYDFEVFYMEESKAYDAELLYREARRDSLRTTYALVHIKEGDVVVSDVLIDGKPIREIVIERQELQDDL